MIPSLVADDLRKALVEYLASTFALSDDDAREALAGFLQDSSEGIFRGPFLRARTPFRSVGPDWQHPLDWQRRGFLPHVHQGEAFARLSTLDNEPRPTIVTTGTGSGKTECFLYPVLDHCARARQQGQKGIKALLLYPMNALAADQAGRIAELIATEPELAGVTAGIYIGEEGRHTSMGEGHLVDNRYAIRDDPPDILLTNYKMLDFLLLRDQDRDLWIHHALRYLVLDEFHTYDGAQGTDVAMLLRRLARTAGLPDERGPLGPVTPVATSATLGTGPGAVDALCEFATRVFGTGFDPEADPGCVIGESRLTVAETLGETNPYLPVPDVADVLALPLPDAQDSQPIEPMAAAFTVTETRTIEEIRDTEGADNAENAEDAEEERPPLGDLSRPPETPVELGHRLLAHKLTRALLEAVSDQPRTVDEVLDKVGLYEDGWARERRRHPDRVAEALARYLWLISVARREVGGRELPLLSVEVQVWVREMSRVLREVSATPRFRWSDAAPEAPHEDPSDATDDDGRGGTARDTIAVDLPAAHCRRCGKSGWMTIAAENSDRLNDRPAVIYRESMANPQKRRVLLTAHPDEPEARAFDPGDFRLHPLARSDGASEETEGADNPDSTGNHDEHRVPVLVTPSEDYARSDRCPACDEANALMFTGVRTASMASVSINTLFASTKVFADERKLLAFADSVQDTSHRAGFFAGRTHRINLRSRMTTLIAEAADDEDPGRHGSISVAELADRLVAESRTPHDRFGLVPPDLLADREVRTTWTDEPSPRGLETLERRVGFEVDLEFGLRSRVGRTLELSGVAAAHVDVSDLDGVVDLVAEDVGHNLGLFSEQAVAALPVYLQGLAERLRLRGALVHPLLTPYLEDDGRLWHVWGGRPAGLPPFTPGQGRPLFMTTATSGDFDSLSARTQSPTWTTDWGMRALGVDAANAFTIAVRAMALLGRTDAVTILTGRNGTRVFGLNRHHVLVTDLAEATAAEEPVGLRCQVCGTRHPAHPDQQDLWFGAPCTRYRCPGRFSADPPAEANYYRTLYRSGTTRRVVTREHHGLLNREMREEVEAAFKEGTAPDAPNVLTATPTLEMGIDIGDLSAVMLTGVPRTPANYTQRVGRAGRKTGNALITTFIGTSPHDLYYLAEPQAMLAGQVRPPSCYLDAADALKRQFVAYLLDRAAAREIDVPPVPGNAQQAFRNALDDGGLFRALIDASTLDPTHIDRFLALFAGQLDQATGDRLREFATGGITLWLERAYQRWRDDEQALVNRARRLRDAANELPETPASEDDRRDLLGQRAAVQDQLREFRRNATFSTFEWLGILPNYTLVEDSVELVAQLWSRGEDGSYETDTVEVGRNAGLAVRELAPGNAFYTGGHRHDINALEIGPPGEPTYEQWRLCPACGYGQHEAEGDNPPPTCPRCGAAGILDAGAVHRMLRLQRVYASSSEEAARTFDEEDERRITSFDVQVTVDVEPDSITEAWKLEDPTFGVERASIAHIRTFNFGLSDRPGQQTEVAGQSFNATRFATCRWCGSVRTVRDDQGGRRPERLHQGWCQVRAGRKPEAWDDVVLYHELDTEAIRLLLPITMFDVEERLVSFTGALLLGLREDFGGDPTHLRVVKATAPNAGGHGHRHFLVLYDSVPGGTGYLARLAEPDRMWAILDKARRVLTTCECADEGRLACHRCLLGVVERGDYEHADRELARRLVGSLLKAWDGRQDVREADGTPGTIAGLDLGRVEESELERRFRQALQEWVASQPAARGGNLGVELQPVTGQHGRDAFDLLFRRDDRERPVIRYRIEEQEGLSVERPSISDYSIHRLDAPGPTVHVYLDGRQFHASGRHNNIADDAGKRRAARADGHLVWNLTWDDVTKFHRAAGSTTQSQAEPRSVISGRALQTAQQSQHQRSGGSGLDARLINHNPMQLLLDYLQQPDLEAWETLALSAVTGAMAEADSGPVRMAADAVGDHLATVVATGGDHDPASGLVDADARGDADAVLVARFVDRHGHPLTLALPTPTTATGPPEERWTVVSVLSDAGDDVEADDHQTRWHSWLQWANLLQFLTPPGLPTRPGRGVAIAGSSQGEDALDHLWLVDTAGVPTTDTTRIADATAAAGATTLTRADLPAQVAEELDLVEDDAVRDLAVRAVTTGASANLVAGHELADGTPLEVAWPDHKVGILPDTGPGRDLSTATEWDIRPVASWSAALDELLTLVKET